MNAHGEKKLSPQQLGSTKSHTVVTTIGEV